MRFAAIDIGSNSAKLLIAEVANGEITRQIIFRHTVTGLSKTMVNNALHPKNSALTLATIIDYLSCCRDCNVERIRITATQFARVATNAAELLEAICLHTGYPVDIISGDEEARLTYLAVATEFANDRILVFNIGGGSTEFIIGTPRQTDLRTSLPIGAGQLSRDFLTSVDNININEYRNMQNNICSLIETNVIPSYFGILPATSHQPPAARIILSGGTGTNIAQIAIGATIDWATQSVQTVKTPDVYRIEELLQSCSLANRMTLPGIEANRADVLPAGAAIVSALLQLTSAQELFITNKSLAHGIICGMIMESVKGER
ncbi:MAG: hypothetical protein WCP79_02835 [Bacillota bacterium]